MLQGSLGPVVSVTQSTELDASLDLTQVSKLSVRGDTRAVLIVQDLPALELGRRVLPLSRYGRRRFQVHL